MIGVVLTAVALSLVARLPVAPTQPPVRVDSVRVCVREAVTSVPIVGAQLRFGDGSLRTLEDACLGLARRMDTVTVSRVGYRARMVALPGDDTTAQPLVVVSLTPRAVAAGRDGDVATLTLQRVVADVPAARPGVVAATIGSAEARSRGVTTMNGVIGLLPFTTLRTARGETGLSLRGARREQVVITLDGLPLNDPATGLADVADVPLVALQSATVVPGADPVNAGNGANGGVLSLSSAAGRVLNVRSGAFGQWAAEAAYTATRGDTRWHVSASHRRAVNDFAFVNDAGAAPRRESRVNNDEERTVLTVGVLSARTQWMLLASTGERGMVGAANVRAYDHDRSRTSHLFVRGQTALGRTLLVTGARRFDLRYREPQRPVFDSRATAWSTDAEWRGSALRGTWRVGVGADQLAGTGGLAQRRTRGFAAWGWQLLPTATRGLALDGGLRTDVVEGNGAQPTGALGATWRVRGSGGRSSWSLLARGAQAVRVPTLYDVYFSSPQRLSVRALDPERVTLDASAGSRAVWQRAQWRATIEASLVSRATNNAIVWFPGNFGWSPANVGREQMRGTETRGDLTGGRLSMAVWHTWYRSELRSGALRIPTPYVPQHSLAANAAWRIGPHTVSTTMRHQGRRPFTAGPRNPAFELPAVTITDVAWSQRHVFARVEALWSLTLDNVTDVQWQSVRGFPMPGRGWSASLTLAPRR